MSIIAPRGRFYAGNDGLCEMREFYEKQRSRNHAGRGGGFLISIPFGKLSSYFCCAFYQHGNVVVQALYKSALNFE